MKKWGIGLVMVIMISYGITQCKANVMSEKIPGIVFQVQEVAHPEGMTTIQVTEDQVYEGDLLLVNKDHSVPPGGEGSKAILLSRHWELVKEFVLLDDTIQLSSRLLEKFSTMVEAAKRDGVNHFMISSGSRDEEEQRKLHEEMGDGYAMPAGFSEHNLGLSLDIGSTQGRMEHVDEGKWLQKNAWKYGFILRYPEDKTAITGIRYEPWHFRYVGLPHSAVMQEKKFVLEEYLAFLKKERSLTVSINGQVYQVLYYPVSGQTTIPVPKHDHYEISGDNMNGVIVTVYAGKEENLVQ